MTDHLYASSVRGVAKGYASGIDLCINSQSFTASKVIVDAYYYVYFFSFNCSKSTYRPHGRPSVLRNKHETCITLYIVGPSKACGDEGGLLKANTVNANLVPSPPNNFYMYFFTVVRSKPSRLRQNIYSNPGRTRID